MAKRIIAWDFEVNNFQAKISFFSSKGATQRFYYTMDIFQDNKPLERVKSNLSADIFHLIFDSASPRVRSFFKVYANK